MEAMSKYLQQFCGHILHGPRVCGLQPQHLLGRREEYAKIA
jgi:hypothetical protein